MRHKLIGPILLALVLPAWGQLFLVAGQHAGHGGISFPGPSREFSKTGKYTGKVVRVDQSSITIETQKKNQAERLTFQLTDQTETKGSVAVGADVKIKYREEMALRVVTAIEVKKAKGCRSKLEPDRNGTESQHRH